MTRSRVKKRQYINEQHTGKSRRRISSIKNRGNVHKSRKSAEIWTGKEMDFPNVDIGKKEKGNMAGTISGVAIFSYNYVYNKFVYKSQSSAKNIIRISKIKRLIRRPLHLCVWSVVFSVVKQNRVNQCMYLERFLLSLRPLLQLTSLSETNVCNNFWLGQIDTWVEVSSLWFFSSPSSFVFSVSTTSSRLFRSDDAGLCLFCHLLAPSSSLHMVLTLLTDSSSPLCLSSATLFFSTVTSSFSSIPIAINDVEVDYVKRYVDFRFCLLGSLQSLNYWVWGMLVILPERWNYDWEEFHFLGGLRNRRDYKIKSSVRKYCKKGKISKARWLLGDINADGTIGMHVNIVSWVEVDKVYKKLGLILLVCYREDKFEVSSAKKGICRIGSLIGAIVYGTSCGFIWDYKANLNEDTVGGRNLSNVGVLTIIDRMIKDMDFSSLSIEEVIIINTRVNVKRKGNSLVEDRRQDSHMQTGKKRRGLFKYGIEEELLSINKIVQLLYNDCEWISLKWISKKGLRKEYITRIVSLWLIEHSRKEKAGLPNSIEVKGREAVNKRDKGEDRQWNNVAIKLYSGLHVWHNHCIKSIKEVKEVSKDKYIIYRVVRNRKRKQAIRVCNVIRRNCKCRIIYNIQKEIREGIIQKNHIVDRPGSSISSYKTRDRRTNAVIIYLRLHECTDSLSQITCMWQVGRKTNNKDQLTKIDIYIGKVKGRIRMKQAKMLDSQWNCLVIDTGYWQNVKLNKTEKSKQLKIYKQTRDRKSNWKIIAVWDDNLKGDITKIRVKMWKYVGYKNFNGNVKRNFDRENSMPILMERMGYVKGRKSRSIIFKSVLVGNVVVTRSKTCLWHDVSTVDKGANLMIRSVYKESNKEWDWKISIRRIKIIVNLTETCLSDTHWKSSTSKNTSRKMKEKLGEGRSTAAVLYPCYWKRDISSSVELIWRKKGMKGQILEDIKISRIIIKGDFNITKSLNELVKSNLGNWVDNSTNRIILGHKRYNSQRTGSHNLENNDECKWSTAKGNFVIQTKYREGRGANLNKEIVNYALRKINYGNRNG